MDALNSTVDVVTNAVRAAERLEQLLHHRHAELARLAPTLSNEEPKPRAVISAASPTGRISESVDVDSLLVSVLDICYIATAVMTTIFVTFIWDPQSGMSFDTTPSTGFIAWLIFVYFSSAAWLYLRFFLRGRVGEWVVVDDLPSLRSAYLKGWFAFDALTCIPIDLCFIGWSNRVFYFLLLRHFLRYFRLLSLGKSVNPLLGSRVWFTFITFLASMVLVTHIWAIINWSLRGGEIDYTMSVYWAVFSQATVGYGDIVAQVDNVRAFSCVVMFCGICVLASFTTFANSYILDRDPVKASTDELKSRVHALLQYYKVPWSLQRIVIQVMPLAINNSLEKQVQAEIASLPQFVQLKLSPYLVAHVMRRIPLLNALEEVDILQLSLHVKRLFVPSLELMMTPDDSNAQMYFIISGSVDLLTHNVSLTTICTLKEGDWFGEEAFLGTDRHLIAQASSACDVITLPNSELTKLSVRFKQSVMEVHERRKKAVSKHLLSVVQ